MKERSNKIANAVTAVFCLVAAITIFVILINDGTRNISSQIQSLNNHAQAVEMDFAKIREINNTEVTISEEQITVIFKEKDCRLTAVYNCNMELVSIKLQDMRVGRNVEAAVVVVLILVLLSGVIGYTLASFTHSLYTCLKKRSNKNKTE